MYTNVILFLKYDKCMKDFGVIVSYNVYILKVLNGTF